MTNISKHQSSETTKVLLIGDRGSGKTGCTIALAAAGYNLRIADLENGIDIVRNYAIDPMSPYVKSSPDIAKRIDYIDMFEGKKVLPNGGIVTVASGWQKLMSSLDDWKTDDGAFGPITSWTPKDVLVIDSLSKLSQYALNFVLNLNGRLNAHPQQADWGDAQQLVRKFLEKITDPSVRCNVVLTAHIRYMGNEGIQRAYPNTLGQVLPPEVAGFFNTMLACKSTGAGTNLKRKIFTNTTGLLDLKNTAPLKVQLEYPLETGLADYFKAVRT